MASKTKVLFATRAMESPPREGGFVLLSETATRLSGDKQVSPYMFSASTSAKNGVIPVKVFSKTGWSPRIKAEFMLGIFNSAQRFDIVHTAHIPTRQNVFMLKTLTRRARNSGTQFVQTITGLPSSAKTSGGLKELLWGDHIVCQSWETYARVRHLHRSVSLITPWASDKRVRYDARRRMATRKSLIPGKDKVVVFPGEFERLGVDETFGLCLEVFFKDNPDSLVVLACRFDKSGIGQRLSDRFPGRVVSVGETDGIIELLEAADLVIYPVRKMESKFQPPLVLIEALQLGTPVLASSLINIDPSVSGNLSLEQAVENWSSFATEMSRLVKKRHKRTAQDGIQHFQEMVGGYQQIYVEMHKIAQRLELLRLGSANQTP
ncbi:MAG TPA: glycosyltransferase [Candidatus Saccharimonadales bacterium]|nr:glycosyltransferase [Candidatus Saccharimonadales bacterium]